jgi:hypothetical protein
MKKLVSLVIVAILFGTTVVAFLAGQTHDAQQEVQGRFVGVWRLVWLEKPDANETVHKADCTGLLVFTRDGHMSVQVMYRNPRSGGQSGPVQYAQGGYEASFGTYRIDESAHTFVFHVEGAMVRSLIGKDLPRAYELSGNQLVVKSTNPNEHWRVTWEHY